jgi:xylulose-5-phosphate/fructose-6-phosphate phosphoketolase
MFAYVKQALRDKLIEHRHNIGKYGDDMSEIAGWRWACGKAGSSSASDTRGTTSHGTAGGSAASTVFV